MSNINRFSSCKTLSDLYTVFNNTDAFDYNSLSQEELDRVAIVFEANIPDKADMPDRPLTKAGYELIWNITIDTVEGVTNNTEETINPTNNEEETIMPGTVKTNVELAVEEMMGKFTEAKENLKVNAGETKEEYIEKVDDSLNVMKGALGTALNVLDKTLGYSVLKSAILDVMEAGTDGKSSKKDLFKMARKCRELIEEEIKNLEFWGDEESFKKAIQLKALTEDERGKSIFESFVVGVIWISKKVTRKLRQWFKVDDEKSVLGAICRSIAGFASILRAGVQIVWNAGKFAVSFVIAGVVKFVDWIVNAIKSVVAKIKDWATKKDEVLEVEDEDFDESLDEDFE